MICSNQPAAARLLLAVLPAATLGWPTLLDLTPCVPQRHMRIQVASLSKPVNPNEAIQWMAKRT